MSDFLQSMAYPFVACLLLTGIHVYLGIHVIARKVIFVDLALAQIAAFGAIYGVLLGYDFHRDEWAIKGFSLAFATFGAIVLALTRPRRPDVPHEAIIGIIYAVTLAATILGSAHLPHGSDEIRDLLSGSILWVRGDTLAWTALAYGLVAAVHVAFRKPLFEISFDLDRAESKDRWIRAWDFLFYLTFGFVVTSSVGIAGVLLVFAYLVVPAVIAILFVASVPGRLALGWTVSAAVSMLGIVTSYQMDWPSGPTIVVGFGVSLLLAGIVHAVLGSPSPRTTLGHVALGVAAGIAVLGGSYQVFRKEVENPLLELATSEIGHERLVAVQRARGDPHLFQLLVPHVAALLEDSDPAVVEATIQLVARNNRWDLLPTLESWVEVPQDTIREAVYRAVRESARRAYVAPLVRCFEREEDPYLRVLIGDTILELGDKQAFPLLIELIGSDVPTAARDDAMESLRAHASVPSDIVAGPRGVSLLREWWQENQARLEWNASLHRFE